MPKLSTGNSRRLTAFRKPVLVEAKAITSFPHTSLVKTPDGKPATDDVGNVTGETKTSLMKLRFHLGRLLLQHPAGGIITIRHSIVNAAGKQHHKVTWENSFGFKREFYHPHNLADFLVAKHGIQLTTKILLALSDLEQESQGAS